MDPATLWTSLNTMVGHVWDSIGSYITLATGQPVLLIPLAFGFAGATVGLFKRMTRLGGRSRK